MKINAIRMTKTVMGLLFPLLMVTANAAQVTAKITLTDGQTRIARLEGVGCTAAICSRTAIHAKAKDESLVKTRFDALASIEDATPRDAVFVMKSGAVERRSLLTDFRVLHLANPSGGTEKLDLSKVKSVQFLAPVK